MATPPDRDESGGRADDDALVPARAAGPRKPAPYSWEAVKTNAKKDPVIVAFLALTVGALGRGLYALIKNDRIQSQRMMRFRVLFQLCTFGAIMGTVYYRAFTDQTKGAAPVADAPRIDKRVWMQRADAFDLPPGASATAAARAGAGAGGGDGDGDGDAEAGAGSRREQLR